MKKVLLALLIVAVATTGIIAKSKDKKAKAKAKAKVEASDETAITALKFFLSKQNDFVFMLRSYQYTVTTEKENPYSYVVGDTSGEAAKEAGLTKKDKGKFISAFSNREGARIMRLWDDYGDELLALLPKAKYDELLKYDVDAAITYHENANFADHLAKLKKACPKPNKDVADKAGEIAGWENYKQLSFWYRRSMEKNEAETFEILKQIQDNYK